MTGKYDGGAPSWNREADDHRPTRRPPLCRIDLGDDGYIDFVDERLVHPDGEVVVVAVGLRAAERARFLINSAGATPQELFMALAPPKQHAPPRLLEDHEERAANDYSLAREPRALHRKVVFTNFAGPSRGRTTYYEITAGGPEDAFGGCAYVHFFFTHWASFDTQAIEEVTWPEGYAFIEHVTQRALGLCYFPGSDGGGAIDVWLESGIGGFFPIIWSDTFEPEHYVWFKTGTYLAKGISHLHWSNLSSGSVRLVGTWSNY